MAVIPESVRQQLKDRFDTVLSGPVKLTLYTRPGSSRLILPAGLGCPTCEDARQMAELLRDAAPDKVTLEVVDVSRDAVALARENAERLGLEVELRDGDGAAAAAEGWDVVLANPPYVESLEELQPELSWEPAVALIGQGEHERLARAANARYVVFETGDDQAADVAEMLERLGYVDVAITADLTGRDRVVEGRRP